MIEMNGLEINVLAVLVATLASFALSFVWYTVLFMKPWIREMNYDPNMRPDAKGMVKGMALGILGNFLFAWVLAFYLAGWKFIPGSDMMGSMAFGINSALSVWIGFFLPLDLSRVAWEKHSWKLFGINAGYHLASAIVVGLIIALWM